MQARAQLTREKKRVARLATIARTLPSLHPSRRFRYVQNQFSNMYKATIGADFCTKDVRARAAAAAAAAPRICSVTFSLLISSLHRARTPTRR